jgi:hypothetical protein
MNPTRQPLAPVVQSVPVTTIGTSTNSMQWRAPLQLAPGTHQLTVAAQVLNGLYTTYAAMPVAGKRTTCGDGLAVESDWPESHRVTGADESSGRESGVSASGVLSAG